jgi:REP element-mobilizing transposase RayT
MQRNPSEQLYTGGFYHVYNRGVDKRQIFMDDGDRFRFLFGLYEFNDVAPALNFGWKITRNTEKWPERDRLQLVDILAFVLMGNHFHLLLRQARENGVSDFMKKLGVGYAKYFNVRHSRTGALFQGRFQYRPVEDDSYLFKLHEYIHLNPAEILKPSQKLTAYAWSSLPYYQLGRQDFAKILNTNLAQDLSLSALTLPEQVGERTKKRAHSLGVQLGDLAIDE